MNQITKKHEYRTKKEQTKKNLLENLVLLRG